MSDSPLKGRRAAQRRREQQGSSSGPPVEESTTPGERGLSAEDAAAKTNTRVPVRQEERTGTRKTGVTSVGSAAHNLMRQADPLEQTRVRANVGPAPTLPGGRIICLAGREVGKSFDLPFDEMLVGRSADAHIRLTDPALSRKHFEIRYDADRDAFLFHPLVTDPPSLLNGEEVTGSARELTDGDLLDMGETQLRFVRVDAPAPAPRVAPAPAPPPDPERQGTRFTERTRMMLLRARTNAAVMKRALGVLVLLTVALVVGGAFGFRAWEKHARESALNAEDGAYQTLLRQARAQRESHRWPEMMDTARSLGALAPERGDGERLLDEARSEQLAERNLNLGRMNATNGNWDAARAALRLVPDASVYRGERDSVLGRVNDVGRNASLANLRKLLADGRYREAAELAEHHLLNYPDDAEVSSLRAGAVKSELAREAMGSATWQSRRQKALQALDAGDFTQAMAFAEGGLGTADEALARSFLTRLRELESVWKKGRDLVRKKDARALGPLSRARELNQGLAGRNSLTPDISRALADAHFLAGVDAMQSGRECDARPSFERADAERPGDTKVTEKLARLSSRGREFLGKAEAARAGGKQADARKLAKEAACRLKRGDDDHARAEKLAGGRG